MEFSTNFINIDNAGDYKIDILKSAIIIKGNESISLQEMELKLVLYFVENKGEIMSKTEIMLNLWPSGAGGEYNLVQLVYKIRKIMKYCNQGDCIVTRRNYGYGFVPSEISPIPNPISAPPHKGEVGSYPKYIILSTLIIVSVLLFIHLISFLI